MVDDVLVVGAGLCGVVLAEQLQQAGAQPAYKVLEARARAGGRILTVPTTVPGVSLDLGPTWFWPDQVYIQALLRRLQLSVFTQYDAGAALLDQGAGRSPLRLSPEEAQPLSYRVAGGVQAVIAALLARLPDGAVRYGQVARRIEQVGERLRVITEQGEVYAARHVVVTLPPRLAAALEYRPSLPPDVLAAMRATQTWMGQAMKVGLVYASPFWREEGLSGLAVSRAGPVDQFHDASPAGATAGALFGWLGDERAARDLAPSVRREAVIAQAMRLFGPGAKAPLDYAECNWRQEPFTSSGHPMVAAEHPHYGTPLLQAPQMDGRLHWAGTEVSPRSGGYLDGAVYIAQKVADRLTG